MNGKENWKRFCEITKQNYSAKEETVQKVFEKIFYSLFGYDPFEEIEARRVLHIGSTDRVIPDIIIRDASKDKDLFIVELKQLNMYFDKKYEEQLISYMRLLSLRVGILICNAIYVYVLEGHDPISRKIKMDEENGDGEAFLDMFSRETFSFEHIKEFINEAGRFDENVEKIRKEVSAPNFDLKGLVQLYFAGDYKDEEIEEALKDYAFFVKPSAPPPPLPPVGETIQEWVKRICHKLFADRLLSEQEIHFMHDLEYSKRTFGIAYAFLVNRQIDTVISGHARYWQKQIGPYYVCSQWWVARDHEYEANIRRWLNRVVPDYIARGLDRRKSSN